MSSFLIFAGTMIDMRARRGSNGLRIIVLGYIVRGPIGGLVWHHLQYVMGLAKLGHEVYFVEDSGDSPWCCYDPSRHVTDSDPTFGLRFAQQVFELGGVGERWAYYDAHRSTWHGPADRVPQLCETADLLLNLGGVNTLRNWFKGIPRRALVDTDPAFTQIKHLTDPAAHAEAAQHTSFFSFAENIVAGTSTVPVDGFAWQATRQPMVLDAWPVTPMADGVNRFTTVMQWNSYPPREYAGRRFGMKSDSFTPYLELPRAVSAQLEVAVGGDAAREALSGHGWIVRDPLETIADAEMYRRYLRESSAEFTVAKHGYVVTNTGWFSERSAAYLATGRPVITQDTGFRQWLRADSGVLAFSTPEEAAEAIHAVAGEYQKHSTAARVVAEEYFDAAEVLPSLISRAMEAS
jgi:hypothetical protein